MILALTGAIGCGKSTALSIFATLSWRIIDSDLLCHELYATPQSPINIELGRIWGKEFLTSFGVLDRALVAKKIFNDEKAKKELTALLYPLLVEKINGEIERANSEKINAIVEIPLLFEENLPINYDATISIWCDQTIRHRHLMKYRNFTFEEITARENAQMKAEKKLEFADYGLINHGDKEFMKQQIINLIKELI